MAASTFKLDSREWKQAVLEYSVACHKTMAEAANRQTNNLAIHAHEFCEKAQKAEIENVQTLEWWPKMVAKAISRKYGKQAGSLAYRAHWSMENNRNFIGLWHEKAKEMSDHIIRQRSVAVGFCRFFFVQLSRAIKTGRSIGGKTFAGFSIDKLTLATETRPHCEAQISYGFRKRSDKTARKVEEILQAAVDKSIPETIRDMQDYTAKQLEKEARKYSAR
jgi:hypothetical protein